MRILPPAVIAAALTAAAAPAFATSHDYYVQMEAYNGLGYQPYFITMDWLNGTVLTQPEDACGMRFEGDYHLHWHSYDYGLEDTIDADDAIADVWLPSS